MRLHRTWSPGPKLGLMAAAMLVAVMLAIPATASAACVRAKPDVPVKTDVTVSLEPTETPGLAMLLVDGSVVRTAEITTATPLVLTDVLLTPGTHRLNALIRSSAGFASSPSIVVRSWGTPGKAAISGLHAGIYHVDQPLTITAGASTTKITAVLNGKTLWTRNVMSGQRFTCTFTLPAGADTLELKATNPCSSTSSNKVTMQRALWPTPGYYSVGSEFGMRDGRMHKGIDIHAPYGAKVVAIAPGKVLWAENLTTYGGLVLIDHGGHIVSYYAHLSKIEVKLGQDVTAGQEIGHVGIANSAHLHFQVYINALGWADCGDKFRRVNSGTWTDPRLWVGYP